MGCSCAKAGSVEDPQGGGRAKASKPPSSDVIAKKVAQAKSTRVLALRECGLKQLPAAATGSEYESLRTADLTANSLKALPEACGVWAGLSTLLCGQNQLAELPAGIGQLARLEKLTLSQNQLRTLPIELSQLGKLKTLQLDTNSLGKGGLPADVFGGNLAGVLEDLDLSGNGLEELPASISTLFVLQRLILAKNRLRALPDGLGRLTKLQHLDAADNLLTGLPDGFLVSLSSLSELWLKGNQMDRLQLQETPGFEAFLERRKQRLDAKIEANVVGRVDLTVCGLE